MRTISATTARRLAITRQRLAGKTSKPNDDGIFDVVKDLGFLQLDPTNVVAPSHQLVAFSRVGPYQPKHLDLGARAIDYDGHMPSRWRRSLSA